MTTRAGLVRAGSGLGLGTDWRQALGVALEAALAPLEGEAPDLVVLFASASYRQSYAELLAEVADRARATEVAGCSASGVIAGAREVEQEAGVAALALRLPPGALLSVRHVSADDVRRQAAEQVDASGLAGMPSKACHGIVVLADPFSTDIGTLLGTLEHDYPGVPIVGGLATGFPGAHWTAVFHGLHANEDGAVVIGLGGSVGVRPVVSQGCEPIGEAWTVTDASEHIVRSIGSRPAYQVLVETIHALSPAKRERVSGNLLVGLAMDEYRDEFRRGDFLIRNLIGIDPSSGAIAIAAQPRVGQTLQFQIRDARAADEELRHMLGGLPGGPSAALLFACNGRGAGLFGAPDHDARTVHELLGPLPLAGLFCNGEIGPVGAATYLHGFTASLALIAPT
jgi:small ligand-binding sensory domain FIST